MSYLEDILEQPQALQRTLDVYPPAGTLLEKVKARVEQDQPGLILFTGMGSSHYCSYPGCIYLNGQRLWAVMLDSAELLHYYSPLVNERVLLVATSQSGESVEVRKLVEKIQGQAPVLSVTNGLENFLAQHSDLALYTEAGEEQAVSTKTYTTTLVVHYLLVTTLTSTLDRTRREQLSRTVEAAHQFLSDWQKYVEPATELLKDCQSLCLLGRGPSMASAMTGAVIIKESAKVHAEGLSCGQFRHGPLELATPDLGVIIFSGAPRTLDLNHRLAQDVARFGGKVVLIGSTLPGSQHQNTVEIPLPSLDEFLLPVVEMLPIQLLSIGLAEAKGLAPGQFRYAGKVTLEE